MGWSSRAGLWGRARCCWWKLLIQFLAVNWTNRGILLLAMLKKIKAVMLLAKPETQGAVNVLTPLSSSSYVMGDVTSLQLISRDKLYFVDSRSLSPCYDLPSPLPFINCLSKLSHCWSDDFFQGISLLDIIWFAEFPFCWAISWVAASEDFIMFGIRTWLSINILFLHGSAD